LDIEDAVQKLIQKRNFKPGKKYTLERIHEIDGRNGGTLRNYEKIHTRTVQLERDPHYGTGLYDLKDEDDFTQFFEENYGNMPNGRYTARTSRGGNDGMTTLFELRLENGEAVNWWKKSQPPTKYHYSSRYFAFPLYFKIREDLGV